MIFLLLLFYFNLVILSYIFFIFQLRTYHFRLFKFQLKTYHFGPWCWRFECMTICGLISFLLVLHNTMWAYCYTKWLTVFYWYLEYNVHWTQVVGSEFSSTGFGTSNSWTHLVMWNLCSIIQTHGILILFYVIIYYYNICIHCSSSYLLSEEKGALLLW